MNIIEWKKDKINGILSTFDRVIIKGYPLQMCNVKQMKWFLSYNNILLKDFGEYANKVTTELCEHIENIAKEQNKPYQFVFTKDFDKSSVA